MTEAADDSALNRVLRALIHPTRRQVLRALVDGPGSATTISRELDLNLGVVSYHLNQVLAEECGIVELVETIQRRGAFEKVYRLKLEALSEGEPGAGKKASGDERPVSIEETFIAAVVVGNAASPPAPAS